MTSGLARVHSFSINFLRLLYATKPGRFTKMNDTARIDIFEKEILLLPFEACGHKSLFVVIGANNIRQYTNTRRFHGSRPCILHLDPICSHRSRHNHRNVADKLRVWLNVLWRSTNNENDRFVMPFNKRSLPVIQPKGA